MTGIQYITNDKGERTAAVIDLELHGELWEDFFDVVISEEVEGEQSIPWEQAKEELRSSGQLDG